MKVFELLMKVTCLEAKFIDIKGFKAYLKFSNIVEYYLCCQIFDNNRIIYFVQ